MKPFNLTKTLKPYQLGWVAIDNKKNVVVAHAKSFPTLANKIKKNQNVFLMPASANYFGLVPIING